MTIIIILKRNLCNLLCINVYISKAEKLHAKYLIPAVYIIFDYGISIIHVSVFMM